MLTILVLCNFETLERLVNCLTNNQSSSPPVPSHDAIGHCNRMVAAFQWNRSRLRSFLSKIKSRVKKAVFKKMFKRLTLLSKPSNKSCALLQNVQTTRAFSTTSIANQNVSQMTPEKFQEEMQKAGIQRGYVVYDANEKKVITSHPLFEELGQFISNDKRDFLNHEACFFQVGPKTNLLFSAFLHKSNRGLAHGGVRFWKYNTMEDYLRDGLRLSLGMTRKNALAGLWWGGGRFYSSVWNHQLFDPSS